MQRYELTQYITTGNRFGEHHTQIRPDRDVNCQQFPHLVQPISLQIIETYSK